MEYPVSIFESIKNRTSLPVFQAHCRMNNLPTSASWEKLKEKLDEEISRSPARKKEIESSLAKIYKETLSLGKRAVKLFKIDKEKSEQVFNILASLKPEQSAYLENFPQPADLDMLANLTADAYLCQTNISDEEKIVTNIFCSKRSFIEKEERKREDIGSDAINEFGWQNYDEFIFIKRRYSQCFEYVRFNKETCILEVIVEERSGSDTSEAFNLIQTKINSIFANVVSLDIRLINPVNFFPAINAIYQCATEGIISELGFTTVTGSAKLEKMRITKKDLREEEFHLGGKDAIGGALTPFRVAVRWNVPGQTLQEEALLPGSIRQLGSGVPHLDHVVLSRALTPEAMQDMLARIIKHLPKTVLHLTHPPLKPIFPPLPVLTPPLTVQKHV